MAQTKDPNFGQSSGTNSALQKLDTLASRFFCKYRKGNQEKGVENEVPHVSEYAILWEATSKSKPLKLNICKYFNISNISLFLLNAQKACFLKMIDS